MTKKQALHILLLGLVGIVGGVADYLSQSHYVWAPIAVAILADLKQAFPTVFKPPVAVLALIAIVGLSGCKTLGPTPPPGTPGFANCSDAALHAAALNLLPSLENAVALAPYSSAAAAIEAIITQEAITVGGPLALAEATCAIQWILSEAQKAAPTTGDSLEATKASNAQRWLSEHPAAQ